MFINLETEMVMDMFGLHPGANWPSGSRTQEVSSFALLDVIRSFLTLRSDIVQWEIEPLGHGYTIRNVGTGMYLSVVAIENTAPIFATHYPVAWYFRRVNVQEEVDPCYDLAARVLSSTTNTRTCRICWPHTPYKFELAFEDPVDEERRRRDMDFEALTLYKQRCRRWRVVLRVAFREEPMHRRRREAGIRGREAARERRPAGPPVMHTTAPMRTEEAETPVYVVAPSSTTEPGEPAAPGDTVQAPATRAAHPSVTELEYGSLERGTAVPTEPQGASPSVTAYTPTVGPSGTETESQSLQRQPTLGRRLRRFLRR
ncbi:hypothetical protein EDD16DRAFT_1702834 [Pisolithus croceorrhizus]|nr:hypothetical protein EDD16DRAFT_1702834 [Pisolithus croceorrhizus]